jgi:hypothetical protein
MIQQNNALAEQNKKVMKYEQVKVGLTLNESCVTEQVANGQICSKASGSFNCFSVSKSFQYSHKANSRQNVCRPCINTKF